MKYFKCENFNDCTQNCKIKITEEYEKEPCHNDDFENMANWQEITKEEFLKEIE